jgi:hypothetical protein
VQQRPVCSSFFSAALSWCVDGFAGEDIAGRDLSCCELFMRAEKKDRKEGCEECGEDSCDDGFPDQSFAAANTRDEQHDS